MIFHLHRSPEALGASVVRRIAADTLSSDQASPHALSRLCFVLGDLALKLLVYSEVCLLCFSWKGGGGVGGRSEDILMICIALGFIIPFVTGTQMVSVCSSDNVYMVAPLQLIAL